ncbi:MAG: hypothetical protein IKH10_03775, partial [Bacteroidetes bacterium]|nr:hypothetical protein [Bacteroidota bacterium]
MNGFYDIVNSKDVLIAAHRGNSLNTPENTIIAFEKAVEAAVAEIQKNAQKVKNTADKARVATVSSSSEFIGKLISEAM